MALCSLAAHHAKPFAKQTEQAKRQRTERVLSVLDRQNALCTCMQNIKKTCSFCYVSDPYTPANHMFAGCKNIDSAKFFSWRKEIRYSSQMKGKVCYHCHVPQGEQDALHPMFSKDDQQCEFRDIIAPVVFALILHTDEGVALRKAFPTLDPSSLAAALVWINSETVEGHFSNLTALFLWFCQQHYK
jgi:hypothetical protein